MELFVLALAAIAVLGALLWRKERQLDRLLTSFEVERQSLLTRIQHPQVIQLPDSEREEVEQQPDEFALVGQVR